MSAGDLDEGLLDHLTVEFFDHGRQAVEFLRSAQALASAPPAGVPRVGNVIAYCVREAMKVIPASQDVSGGGQWRTKSRSVVDAKRRYELTRNLPGEDSDSALRDLLTCIDDMALTHQEESIHQKRLIAVIVNRTGAQPLASGVEPVRVYQGILTRLDEAVHPGHRKVGIEEARQLWTDCVAILRQLFLPPEARHRELDVLAAVASPGPDDVSKLVALLAGPNHLHYFLSKIQTPAWLDILLTESTLLEPPTGQAAWPVFAAVAALKDAHGLEVAAVLMRMMEKWGSHPQQAFYLTQASVDLGKHGREIVLRALGKHRGLPGISLLAVLAASMGDPSDDFVESVAEIVLDGAAWDRTSLHPESLLHSLVAGLTSENYTTRIKLLCYKLRKVPQDDLDRQYFLVDNIEHLDDEIPPYRRRVPFYSLLDALVESLKKAFEWAPFDDLLQAMSMLPDNIKNRVRTWLLGAVGSVGHEDLISEVAGAISSRYPTSDDLRVVDRAVTECDTNEYVNRWSDAVGTPPTVAELSAALATDEVLSSWRRVFLWSALLPPQATTAWTTAVAIMSAAYGEPSREMLEQSNDTELSYGHSPLSESNLRDMRPDDAARWIAAWRPESQWLVSARQLGRTLQAAVKADTTLWLAAPLTTATLLRHPTYIHHYLQGLAEAESFAGAPVDEILDLIVLVRAHPWEAVTLGDATFDFDPDWRPAEHASIDLIKAMAASDAGFGNRRDEVWAILHSEIGNHSEPSGIGGDARDPLETAINRPCTRALEVALSFLAHEYRLDSTVRPAATELLTSILQLKDRNGAEHRAILAPRLGFLRYIAPDWVEQHRDQLFDDAAPTGLGQVTVDLAIKWGQPNRWLLENYPDTIKDAVKRNAEHALDHYLIAMLWNIPGYSLQDSFAFLKSKGLLSTAGERLGRLLRAADISTEPVDLAVQFWKFALADNVSDSLAGFGWFAEIDTIATDTWTNLTLQTVTATRGRIDWAHKVAERTAAQPPTPKTLDILNQLVRGPNDNWDRQKIAQLATQTLNQAQYIADSPEYKRLQTTLTERNAS